MMGQGMMMNDDEAKHGRNMPTRSPKTEVPPIVRYQIEQLVAVILMIKTELRAGGPLAQLCPWAPLVS